MKPSLQVGSVSDHIGWWRVLAAVRAAGIAELWSVFDRHRVSSFLQLSKTGENCERLM